MAEPRRNKILQEAIRRSGVTAPSFSSKDYCFQKQYEFISDTRKRFKTAVCSRRAGKTEGIAADLIDTCLSNDNVECLYITLTSRGARTIIWNKIKHILEDYKIDCKTDDTRLEVTFQNRSILHLGGAKDEAEVEKYRGWKLKKVYIDEAQSFRPYIKYFIEDILMPALRDQGGTLALTGTPGPVPAGPFYEITQSKEWAHHHWTAFDNPHMKNLEETLAEERAVKGIDESDAGYIRETYGRWIEDFNSLVFKFSPDKNLYQVLPPEKKKMDYIFGIDIGFNDADAIAVLGYSYTDKNVYLIEEVITTQQDITSLVEQINILKAKYNPVKMVMDAGALGKKIQEEILQRHSLNLEAAEKTRKIEFIELLNDDLRRGRFKAFNGSRFQQDALLVQWDRSVHDKKKISDIYHSDITDAVLYGWRECRHYFARPEVSRPMRGTKEYWDLVDKESEEAEELQFKAAGTQSVFEEEIDLNNKEYWEE